MFKDRILHLFDLDGTAVDSFHRVAPCLGANGDLNLHRYRAEACTHEKIMADQLLPLADHMKALIDSGESVGICTARSMRKSDYVFLRQHGLKTALIASRDRLHKAFPPDMAQAIMRSGDAAYKSAWIQHLKATRTETMIHLYDDHEGVLEAAKALGVVTFNATTINEQLNIAFKLGMMEGISQCEQEQWEQEQFLSAVVMFDDHDALTFGPLG